MNGRFGQEDAVQTWRVKYAEVCNAMDMVGFEEQVRTKLTVMSSIDNSVLWFDMLYFIYNLI